MTTSPLPAIVSRARLSEIGMSTRRLYKLARDGELEQIAPGIYLRPGELDDTTAAWASISLRKPAATVCLLSALSLHELTDEIPRQSDIALPRGQRTLTSNYAPVHWHSFDRATFDIGRASHRLTEEGLTIGLYTAERTIIDVFRLRHDLGADLAVEALKRWLRRRDSSPSRLLELAKPFPKALPELRSTLEILL